MTNSTFNPTCADDGSVNVYVYMYVCMHYFAGVRAVMACVFFAQALVLSECIAFQEHNHLSSLHFVFWI